MFKSSTKAFQKPWMMLYVDEGCSEVAVRCWNYTNSEIKLIVAPFVLFFSETWWLRGPFCSANALFPSSKSKKGFSPSHTEPHLIRLSVFCPGCPPAAALGALLFCNGYYYFKCCASILTSWEDLVFRGWEHSWTYTAAALNKELHAFNPSLREFISSCSREQTEGSLHFWLNYCFTVCMRQISHTLKTHCIIVWTCIKLDFSVQDAVCEFHSADQFGSPWKAPAAVRGEVIQIHINSCFYTFNIWLIVINV